MSSGWKALQPQKTRNTRKNRRLGSCRSYDRRFDDPQRQEPNRAWACWVNVWAAGRAFAVCGTTFTQPTVLAPICLSAAYCAMIAIQIWLFCPRSSVDRALASEAKGTGSSPVGGTGKGPSQLCGGLFLMGDWGWGTGDWGLGIGQSRSNTQYPVPLFAKTSSLAYNSIYDQYANEPISVRYAPSRI